MFFHRMRGRAISPAFRRMTVGFFERVRLWKSAAASVREIRAGRRGFSQAGKRRTFRRMFAHKRKSVQIGRGRAAVTLGTRLPIISTAETAGRDGRRRGNPTSEARRRVVANTTFHGFPARGSTGRNTRSAGLGRLRMGAGLVSEHDAAPGCLIGARLSRESVPVLKAPQGNRILGRGGKLFCKKVSRNHWLHRAS